MVRWPRRLTPDPLLVTLLLALIWSAFGCGGSNTPVVHNPGTPTGAFPSLHRDVRFGSGERAA